MSNPPFHDVFVDTPAGRILTRQWPGAANATPILLFHDSLGSIELWRDFPALISSATGHPVIAYDRVGFGRSDAFPAPPDSGFIAHEARAVLPLLQAALGFTEFIACGHSVGGAMALHAAAFQPANARGVITLGSQSFVEDLTLNGIRAAQSLFEDPENMARLRKYHGDKAPGLIAAWAGIWLSPAFSNWNLDEILAAVRCPVLAIHGDLDEYGSPAQAARIAENRGEFHILKGVGHTPHKEDIETVISLIKQFVKSVS